jgi:cytidine deaminase
MKKEITISYEYFQHTSELPLSAQERVTKMNDNLKNAYAPYSKFDVSALVVLENGEEILGTNQENIAFPSGLCAERVALFYAGSMFPGVEIKELYVTAKGKLVDSSTVLSPCGSCRQVMAESQNRQKNAIKIYLVGQKQDVHVFPRVLDLLPLAFGS